MEAPVCAPNGKVVLFCYCGAIVAAKSSLTWKAEVEGCRKDGCIGTHFMLL